MSFRAGLHNFSKGVLSPELWARIDIATYNAAVRQGKNVVILKYGGLQKRPGTRVVYEIKDGPKRLLPFEYSLDFTYALLMGQGTMRPASGGGMVLDQLLTVEGATNANPVVITASYHALMTGDEVYFQNAEGMTELNGQVLPVTVLGPHTFSVPLDGTGFGAFTGDEGGTIRVGTPPPPPPPPPVPPPPLPPEEPDLGSDGTDWRYAQDPRL